MKQKDVELYFDIAKRVGADSTAIRSKVGAIMVDNNTIVAMGRNGTPHNDDNTCETPDNVTKDNVIHAEMNMLYKLANGPFRASDGMVFITLSPCQRCAEAFIQSGIKYVFYEETYRITAGVDYLRAKGVFIKSKKELLELPRTYEGHIILSDSVLMDNHNVLIQLC